MYKRLEEEEREREDRGHWGGAGEVDRTLPAPVLGFTYRTEPSREQGLLPRVFFVVAAADQQGGGKKGLFAKKVFSSLKLKVSTKKFHLTNEFPPYWSRLSLPGRFALQTQTLVSRVMSHPPNPQASSGKAVGTWQLSGAGPRLPGHLSPPSPKPRDLGAPQLRC